MRILTNILRVYKQVMFVCAAYIASSFRGKCRFHVIIHLVSRCFELCLLKNEDVI
jgi:hypothetical protein